MRFQSVALLAISLYSCVYKPKNQGESLYSEYCASCHMESGQGLRGLYPPVANSDFILHHKHDLACIIREGMSAELTVNGEVYDDHMAGFPQLTENEISNLVRFILVDLNGQHNAPTLNEIRNQLNDCPISQD